ncbi:MAG: peptide-N4-asparagine amidase [Acidilobus sp.]
MNAKALALIALALVSLAIIAMTPTTRATQQPTSIRPPISVALSPSLYSSLAGKDGYYSFEAFRIVPPNETPTTIWVAKDVVFNHTMGTTHAFTVNVPPGNYSLILLNVSVRELGGAAYDVVVHIFANGTPIFWGSTQEILNSTAIADVTFFENLLQGPVDFQVTIPTIYNPSIGVRGYYIANVSLLLYNGSPPPGLPNKFEPLWFFVNGNHDYASESVEIPNGTFRAWLILYTQGNLYDEFWYTNIPAVRYVKVYYNGVLAGIVNPFQTIYTGGIDLFWWKPVPSVNTLSYHMPDIVDLTPMLAYGLNATIAIHIADLVASSLTMGVPGGAFRWWLGGTLALWVNQSNPLITSEIMSREVIYHDSGPVIMNEGPMGSLYFDEGASYFINYTSMLKFKHGEELATSVQTGKTFVRQAYNYFGTYAYNYLDEEFTVLASASGYEPYELSISADWPITLYYDYALIPITPPSTYPFNATYAQNGSISLSPSYEINLVWPGYNLSEDFNYNLYAIGGFSGIIEFISPTAAVLISLTSNNALTSKTLTATMLVDGKGFSEEVYLEGLQNSTVNQAGYLIANQFSYQLINGGLPGVNGASDHTSASGASLEAPAAAAQPSNTGSGQQQLSMKGSEGFLRIKLKFMARELKNL